ncbi:MAG: hypothetical protein Q8P44_03410, partial [Dehalococcoidia bacterium]|nr:hypothetical protein [Dehalococcoidia bacterium]
GNELLLHTITLSNVPGGANSVDATVTSPDLIREGDWPRGDSLYWSGVNVSTSCVSGVPICNVNGDTPIYTDATAIFNSSAQVIGGGDSDVEIDRNRTADMAGMTQIKRNNCDISSSCTIPPSDPALWVPTAADVGAWKVWCRGWNVSPDPDLECRPFGPYGGSVVGDCGLGAIRDVTVELPPPWFQIMGGDVFSSGSVSSDGDTYSRIPGGAVPPYFYQDKDGYPGVVLAKGEAGFGPNFNKYDAVSSRKWLVEGESYSYTERYDYNYLYRRISGSETILPKTNADLQNRNEWSKLSGSYLVNEDLTVPDGTVNVGGNTGNEKVVIFINGNLNINGKIKRGASGPQKNFVAFIVQGNIVIDGTVSGNSADHAIEGIYLANGKISTGDDSADPDQQFYAQGLFIAWEGFDFQRTYRGSGESQPAEVFEYDVDLVMDAPGGLQNTPLIWTEVAP